MRNAQDNFKRETKTVTLNGKTITIENLTPVLPQKERERREKELQHTLYDVFSKYIQGSRA